MTASLASRVRGRLLGLRWKAAGHARRLPRHFAEPLTGGRILEIGGPSQVFTTDGLLPVYPLADQIDCVQWTAQTAWHSLDSSEGYRPEGTERGRLFLVDDINLRELPDARYDAVVCSHVIEHIANPLQALATWKRVTKPGGHLLMIVPHKEGTFDRRRDTTTLDHLVEDYRQGTTEDDLTHLEETLERHDHARDAEPRTRRWEEQRRQNASTRLLHHHTFTTRSALRMLDWAGLRLEAVETRFPHDIYVLGSWPVSGGPVDNSTFLAARRPSPFRADRQEVRAPDSNAA